MKSCRGCFPAFHVGPGSCKGGPGVALHQSVGPCDEWELASIQNLQTPKAAGEILATFPVRKKEVAAVVGWPLLFVLRKATEAELTAQVKVSLNADSGSCGSETCEYA